MPESSRRFKRRHKEQPAEEAEQQEQSSRERQELYVPETSVEFLQHATAAYQESYSALFTQMRQEAARLPDINQAIDILEQRVTDPQFIEQLTDRQKVELLGVLTSSKQSSIYLLNMLSRVGRDTRTVVAILDGLRHALNEKTIDGEMVEESKS